MREINSKIQIVYCRVTAPNRLSLRSIRLAMRSLRSPSGFAAGQNHDGLSEMIGALLRLNLFGALSSVNFCFYYLSYEL